MTVRQWITKIGSNRAEIRTSRNGILSCKSLWTWVMKTFAGSSKPTGHTSWAKGKQIRKHSDDQETSSFSKSRNSYNLHALLLNKTIVYEVTTNKLHKHIDYWIYQVTKQAVCQSEQEMESRI